MHFMSSLQELKKNLIARCKELDLQSLAKDLSPFVFDQKDLAHVTLFQDFINQWQI